MKRLVMMSALVAFSVAAKAEVYKLDSSHLEVGFSVKHLMISNVKGHFKKVDGTFEFNGKTNELSKVDVKIDPATVDTAEPKRDEHLVSPDFFDVKKFPTMTFVSDKVVKTKANKTVKAEGNLTLHGITKPVTLDVEYRGSVVDPYGNERVGFSLSGVINRKDFGLNWNKTLDKGGVAVSDEVKIDIEGEAVKAAPEKAAVKK